MLSQVVAIQRVVSPPNAPTMASRVRDFTRMYPFEFHGSKFNEDLQEFIDEVYNIVDIMGVSSEEKVELAAYKLKGIAQVWYTQWKFKRVDEGPIGWEAFKLVFLDRFFPLEIRETKVLEFINIRQGNMVQGIMPSSSTKLSKYASSLVANPHARMSQFISGVSDLVAKEF
ncbi:uncharacterized protein LOC129899843 [Solanum dulcamara]|uniref:uncharacterized protein LOC129899843 n=1 Tax=Solanum dulcamara TaxID=45834 RepID=UPI0024852AB8|nr:uncharacterized protein LOC129899843 [Solanum dulcamara]